MKVAPNTVSGRVVKTRMPGWSSDAVTVSGATGDGGIPPSSSGKTSSAPSLLPIQLRWALVVVSDQSRPSRLSSSRWA